MSKNIGILYKNLSDDLAAVLTASHEAGDRTVAKLQSVDITDIWRGNATTVNIIIDFAAAKGINAVSLINTNLTSGATWQVRGATSQANLTSAPGYDSGSISAWPAGASDLIRNNVNPFLFIETTQSYRWWRIDLVDGSNADSVIDAGRLVMGEAFQPGINANYGLQLGVKDLAKLSRTRGGQPDFDKIGKLRTIEFALSFLTTDEAFASVFDMQTLNGISADVLVFPLPLRYSNYWHMNVIWGTMVQLAPIELRAFPASKMRWHNRIKVEERI